MKQAIILIVGIVLLFAALGRLDTEKDDGRIPLEFWCYGTGGAKNPGAAFWERLAREFESIHPEVRVKAVTDIAHGPYLSVLTTRFIGGNPPDVMITDDGYVGQLAHEGLIQSLEEFIRAEEAPPNPRYRSKEYPPSMVRDGYVDGERFGIPWYGGFGCLYYRTDILSEAGLDAPETWEELLTVCRALQEDQGLEHPFAMDPKTAFWMMPWIWQNGGSIASEDLRTITIDTPEFVGGVQFVHDLMHKHGVMNPDLATGAKATDMWATGQAAMTIDGSWWGGRYDEFYPQWEGKWATAPVPVGKVSVGFFGGQHLIMSKTTAHPDLAWEFMAFVTSAERQYQFAVMTGNPPGNLKVYDMPEFRKGFPYFDIVPTVIKRGRNNPFCPFFTKIWYRLFQSNVLDVVMKEPDADIAAAVQEAAVEMQQVSDDYWATHEYFVQGLRDQELGARD